MFTNFKSFALSATAISFMTTISVAPVLAQTTETAPNVFLEQLIGNENPDLLAFYETNGLTPIWAGNPARLLALITALENSGRHGMPTAAYDIAGLEQAWAASGNPASDAVLEILAAELFVEFATDLTSGILEPSEVVEAIFLSPKRPETGQLLAMAANSVGNGGLFESLEPTDPSYNVLQTELARLDALVSAGGWGEKIAEGRTIRAGHSGARVLAIRQRLNDLGYEGTDGVSNVYDADLVLAMQAFQNHNALDADGIVGPKTLLALNSDPSEQMRQVIVNLERRRWLNYDLGDRHIFVNQAAFLGYVIDNGVPTLVTRVVVGRTGSIFQTPEFNDNMSHMVINPSWNVPQSIATRDYLPKLLRDPSVLARQNFVMQVRGSGAVVDARLIDMSQYSANNFPFVLRQRPGSNNALGKVKFMFPNRHNIYLHDSPAKSLFTRDTRAYSAGCVRVQRPFDLAYSLLSPQEADPEAAFQSILRTGRETQVNLETPVPIYLSYQTVFIDQDGDLAYRVDIYGRDKPIFDALAQAGVSLGGVEG
ncbi:MAG: L,D-transpeptidase family protein [Rhodobacteraceae bacterium]|nr:L,D-transpeptidase family protein [Paracoccaceae bacterium]